MRCGDGRLAFSEACDDANTQDGDGCSALCHSTEVCGNGIVDGARGEQCDDGNAADDDFCHSDCKLPHCGDGLQDAVLGESCDAGSANSALADAACRPICQPQRCGDGVTDSAEICDDGNLRSGDGCAGDCLSRARCGNGYLDALRGEQCDDQDAPGRSFDGCASTCQLEVPVWRIVAGATIDPHSCVALRYDTTRDVAVAVISGGGVVEYEQNIWHARHLRNYPNAFDGTRMVYDPIRRRHWLFGGVDSEFHNELWGYDGTRWQRIKPAKPARLPHTDVGQQPSARRALLEAWMLAARAPIFGNLME